MFSPCELTKNLSLAQWRQAMDANYSPPEADYVAELTRWLNQPPTQTDEISQNTLAFLQRWRDSQTHHQPLAQELMYHYGLDSREGVVLMCLAEALMRIPDKTSAREFIADKLKGTRWRDTPNSDEASWFSNAATWSLALGERLLEPWESSSLLRKMTRRLSEPVIHRAIEHAVTWMADTFVFAETLPQAIKRVQHNQHKPTQPAWRYCFDLLGEAALSHKVAAAYRQDYLDAIQTLAQTPEGSESISLSVKLSALHPRYEALQAQQLQEDLIGTSDRPGFLVQLAQAARAAQLPITLDAEESDRLEISLDLLEAWLRQPELKGWNAMGLAVQAYSKRALPVLGFVNQLAQELGITVNIRLVKGAYWDSEIDWAQRAGLSDYPVFTDKTSTDISYLACAKYLLQASHLKPQFATHNLSTIYSLLAVAQGRRLEFQRLQGMGETIYQQLLSEQPQLSCRVYAPIGDQSELLPYLVRRLLENGANNSFVNQLHQVNSNLAQLAQHPLSHSNPSYLAPPSAMFEQRDTRHSRRNSAGLNLQVRSQRNPLLEQLDSFAKTHWQACAIVAGKHQKTGHSQDSSNPANPDDKIGAVYLATREMAEQALDSAYQFQPRWREFPVTARAEMLEKASDLFEDHRAELCALLMREAGKTLADALDEVREAVDFCRYYAEQARTHLEQALQLPGPVGEHNQLHLEGRGVFACISPWNFPLAIFISQLSAALVSGNTVLAKPARQTCLVAYRAVELLFEAGVPAQALHFLPGNSGELSPLLTGDSRIQGVAFTGSTQSGRTINQALAARPGSIATLIAETGGQNALIADSTCLPEQLVKDVIRSAFGSAGQRCSALRVLYVQEDIADQVTDLISGAMNCLQLGDPQQINSDIGPVIDHLAWEKLHTYIEAATHQGRLIAQTPVSPALEGGNFIAPCLLQLNSISELNEEHFGPICHLVRFSAQDLDQVIDEINACGFGLTLGIHSRNEGLAEKIAARVNVGNVYINRNIIGAVVGVQPFGGCGLSGTGPKAGGPHYLLRFVREKTVSNNLAAIGGNIHLLNQPHKLPKT